jgi:hypothetical protein
MLAPRRTDVRAFAGASRSWHRRCRPSPSRRRGGRHTWSVSRFPDVSGEGDIVPPEVVPGRDVAGLLVLGVLVVFLVEVDVLVIEILVEVKIVLGKQTMPLRAPVAPDR